MKMIVIDKMQNKVNTNNIFRKKFLVFFYVQFPQIYQNEYYIFLIIFYFLTSFNFPIINY
jgi:hypothetical protein